MPGGTSLLSGVSNDLPESRKMGIFFNSGNTDVIYCVRMPGQLHYIFVKPEQTRL